MGKKIKIAYVHSMHFPCAEANAFDSVWAASALSKVVDTTFFVRDSTLSYQGLKDYYYIADSPLAFKSMYLNFIPDRVLLKVKNAYEKALFGYFRMHPGWQDSDSVKRVLYIRDPKALLFWGQARERHPWLREWIFMFEAHDPLGLDPNNFHNITPFDLDDIELSTKHHAVLQAARNFDTIICNSQSLVEDIEKWSRGAIRAHSILIGSNVPRISSPVKIPPFGEKIVLGYIGTVDLQRGVDILLKAMRFLPNRFHLRLVGRFPSSDESANRWLQAYLEDPILRNRVELKLENPIKDVAGEIDGCDILVQTASNDKQYSRYGVPLKAFCYMNRGKPILAGDVPCFHEFFQDGKNALYYQLNPKSLAQKVQLLVEHPDLAEQIAKGALEQAVEFDLSRRAEKTLALINQW